MDNWVAFFTILMKMRISSLSEVSDMSMSLLTQMVAIIYLYYTIYFQFPT